MNTVFLERAYRQQSKILLESAILAPSPERERILLRSEMLRDAADAFLLAWSICLKANSSATDALVADFDARAEALSRGAE